MDIQKMKLYQHYERVDNELRAMKIGPNDPLTASQLYRFDNLHYFGVDAVKEAFENVLSKMFPATSESSTASSQSAVSAKAKKPVKKKPDLSKLVVLDVGSGLGGPSRFLAETFGCKVVALELQREAHEKALELTKRCSLEDQIEHRCGDILNFSAQELTTTKFGKIKGFDVVVSWLAFLHVTDKDKLLGKCASVMKRNAYLCFEDFYELRKFSEDEEKLLEDEVSCVGLPTKDGYVQHLTDVGFGDIDFKDMTKEWAGFVHDRFQAYVKDKPRLIKVHNPDTYESQRRFFEVMDTLFSPQKSLGKATSLGGVRVTSKFSP